VSDHVQIQILAGNDVELNLGGTISMLTPNGDKPGLYEIEMVIKQCPNTKMYEADRIP
jgi:hypothetical protein